MDGKTLSGRYTLGRLLGRGGMGAVYEADDREQGRRVAVKVMNAEIVHSRSAVGRFEREARAASAIQTEHIVRVLDTGVDQDTSSPFLVMELLRGEDLAQLLERLGPLPPQLALRIVAQACVGLQKAHEAGVLHRDIKPANLFLAQREEGGGLIVKVLDFGVAKIKPAHEPHRDTTGLTRSGSMLGTPRYMSPEQARGIKEIDHRTDIWSLGIVLYHALAGRTPTQDVEAFGDLIAALVAELPTPVQEFAPWVAPEVAAIVDGALQYQCVARYPSASVMLEAIRPLLGDDLQLDESMLVPLSPSERQTVAPRFEPRVSARIPRRSSHVVVAPGGSAAPWRDQPTDIATAPALGTSEGPVARWRDQPTDIATAPALETTEARRVSEQAPAPRRPWRKEGVAVAAVLAAGLGWVVMLRQSATPGAAMTYAHLVSRELSERSRTLPVQSAAPPAAPEAPVQHRVELAIVPAEASVEIDGAPAPRLRNGAVELTGTLGSSHSVRVSRGKREMEATVIITEAGSLPPKLELPLPQRPAPERKPRPAAAASAAPPAAPPAPANTHNPLMPQDFVE
ncbi:serine/threonine-protein kinase [Sorangium sp. So ce1389]|uniref:serine/threonine-protein kinase n=1 Tax=Sorangium sp. So ce1389 TaxID=3133336 RepID=UPI003F6070D4